MKTATILLFFLFYISSFQAQTILEADGSGDAIAFINSVLDPDRGRAIETPGLERWDCDNHQDASEPHITEIFDKELNKYVFKFVIHTNEDNDRCKFFDRQRNEIKTYKASPDSLKATQGETVVYTWKFKLDAKFQPSKRFTHIHQLKSVDELPKAKPIITLTPRKGRKGGPDQLELRYANSPDKGVLLTQVDLDLLRGRWVAVNEIVTFDTQGAYKIIMTNVKTNKTILEYEDKNLLLWLNNSSFVRPKWGIYRGLERAEGLRDEEVLFADFTITEK